MPWNIQAAMRHTSGGKGGGGVLEIGGGGMYSFCVVGESSAIICDVAG